MFRIFLTGLLISLPFHNLNANGCVSSICQPQRVVSYSYAQPVIKAAPIVSYYKVAPQYGDQAAAEYQFRLSPSYIRLVQTEAALASYKEAVQTLMAAQQAAIPRQDIPPEPWTPQPENPDQQPAETPSTPNPPQPSGNPQWDSFKATYPTIAAKCASCHGQKDPDQPDGGLYLNGGMDLTDPARRDLIIGKLRRGEMPPDLDEGHRLHPEVLDAIEDELYGVQLELPANQPQQAGPGV